MLSDRIAAILEARENLRIEEIATELYGPDCNDSETLETLERTLLAGHRRYRRSGRNPSTWSLASRFATNRYGGAAFQGTKDPASLKGGEGAALRRARSALPSRYGWQAEALQAWQNCGRRGIVEAVTGSGKTMVGILAMLDTLEQGLKVHIVVPTIDLQKQWFSQVRALLPNQCSVGRRGGGYRCDLPDPDVLISVVNSARSSSGGAKPSESFPGLLIADECHRFASKLNSTALAPAISQRLGLSATYRRDDGGHSRFLIPYFEQVCYSLDYDRARRDRVIAEFDVVLVGICLSEWEQEEYQLLSDEISSLFRVFYRLLGVDVSDFEIMIETLLDSAAGKYSYIDPKIEQIAKSLLSLLRRRRRLLEHASGKLDALADLAPEIHRSRGTVVFTQSVEMSLKASSRLERVGIAASAVHSRMDKAVRNYHIKKFAKRKLQAIVAPRILDEGLDFPDANLAIVLSASNTKRQMIQRMGRILRPKETGRPARIVILFAQNTVEDPRLGAHDMFLEAVLESANSIKMVLAETDTTQPTPM